MSKSSFLNDILNNLLSRKKFLKNFYRSKDTNDNYTIENLVDNILNAKGEASANMSRVKASAGSSRRSR